MPAMHKKDIAGRKVKLLKQTIFITLITFNSLVLCVQNLLFL